MALQETQPKPIKTKTNQRYKSTRFGSYDKEKALLFIKKITPTGTSGLRPFRTVRGRVCGCLTMSKQDFAELMKVLAKENMIRYNKQGIKLLEGDHVQ